MDFGNKKDFSSLKGEIIDSFQVSKTNDEIIIATSTGKYQLNHSQDCCEEVKIKQIDGDIQDILDSPILLAEEISITDDTPSKYLDDKISFLVKIINSSDFEQGFYDESWTWTFYKLATIKGSITISWYGSSNGYYSEGVDLRVINEA